MEMVWNVPVRLHVEEPLAGVEGVPGAVSLDQRVLVADGGVAESIIRGFTLRKISEKLQSKLSTTKQGL